MQVVAVSSLADALGAGVVSGAARGALGGEETALGPGAFLGDLAVRMRMSMRSGRGGGSDIVAAAVSDGANIGSAMVLVSAGSRTAVAGHVVHVLEGA